MDYQKLERARVVVALLAAVVTGGAALIGVYTKARSESRRDTAASYETLAPEVNELKAAIEQLREENRQLRSATGIKAPAPERRPETAQGRTPPRRTRPAAGPAAPPETAPPAEEPASEQPAPAADPPARPEEKILKEVEKKVPVDFESAAEIWKRVKEIRK